VTRIGAAKSVQVDVRVLAATNKHVEEEIAAGRFREDLFHRLNVIPITVPSLRDRLEDVPALVEHFAGTLSVGSGAPPRASPPTRCARFSAELAGNVRELRNGVERLMILAPGKQVTGADVERLLPAVDAGPADVAPDASRARHSRASGRTPSAPSSDASSTSTGGTSPRRRARWTCRARTSIRRWRNTSSPGRRRDRPAARLGQGAG